MSSQLAVGFDLDMTLIDTVPGFGATLRALGEELGVEFPVEELTTRLGPPLEQLLEPHLAAEAVGPAGDRFRELYPEHSIAPVPALPGAHEALAAVRRGSYVALDLAPAVALGFPSVLSIPYALRVTVPKLVAAASRA